MTLDAVRPAQLETLKPALPAGGIGYLSAVRTASGAAVCVPSRVPGHVVHVVL